MTIVSIGEILWDVFEGSEKLGGAPFNFSVHASRLGHNVVFLSAVGDDDRGRAARAEAGALGLPADYIQTVPDAPTGVVSVRVDAAGQPDFTIHRPAAYDHLRLDQDVLSRLAAMQPEWLYYGSLHQAVPASRLETRKLAEALPRAARFYDINLRRDSYTPELVLELMSTSHVVKLNDDEAAAVDAMAGRRSDSLEEFTKHWSRKLGWHAVAVTRGAEGCVIRTETEYVETDGFRVKVADTVGAGDAFAAAFLHGLSQGWDAYYVGDFATRVGALVAARPGGVPPWTIEDCWKLK